MEEEKRQKRYYDREFKLSALRMVSEGGQKAAEVARSLGINPNQLYNWQKKLALNGEKAFPGKGHLSELSALRKELRRVERERDILKKVVGIFSKAPENDSDL